MCHNNINSSSSMDDLDTRISPLRGNMSQEEIVHQTLVVRDGLGSLRDEHYTILAQIRDDYENGKNANEISSTTTNPSKNGKSNNSLLEDRITNVTKSLEQLEVGLAESSALLSLHDHFELLEADRCTLRLEMGRVQDENEWLREELSDTQKQLQEGMAELAQIKEEKKQWEFQEELRNMAETTSVRPITPSKIPVGSWRLDEEKDINRALSGGGVDRESRSRAASPAPSRIPVGGWRSKLSVYKKVMEKQEATEAVTKKKSSIARKSNYFKLNAPTRASKIPSR
jgi:hypothetical protein